MNNETKILIVEDEKIMAYYLKMFLTDNGYRVVGVCDTGRLAIKMARELKPQLIFMDIMLKDSISGAESAVKISELIQTKIVFVTAYSDQEMLDYAIDAHASAYIVKPYNDNQILATLKLVLNQKKSKPIAKIKIQLSANAYYDLQKEKIYVDEEPVLMSHQCSMLLLHLVKHRNHTLTRQELMLGVYGEIRDTSTIRTLIHRLKRYIGDEIIQNVSGVGYLLQEYTEE